MICLLLISIAVWAKDFESLDNAAPTCSDPRPDFPSAAEFLVTVGTTGDCFSYDDSPTAAEWKTYNAGRETENTFSTIADGGDANSLITGTYTGAADATSLDVLLLDALVITEAQQTSLPATGKTISYKGTMWGVHDIGVGAPSGGGDAFVLGLPDTTKFVKVNMPLINQLWTANLKEFGLVYTDCIAEDSEVVTPSSESDYKCIVKNVLIERHHTGFTLAISNADNFVSAVAIKTQIAKYGPIVTTFTCDLTALQTYLNGGRSAGYFAAADATTTGAAVTFLVYGWEQLPPPTTLGRGSNEGEVDVWLVKYLTADLTAFSGSPLLKIEIAANAAPTNYDATKAAGPVYFYVVKNCASTACGTCDGVGCTCAADCAVCEGHPFADTTGCACSVKCNLCPEGASKSACECDETMDCSECAALSDKSTATCTCAADCAGCADFEDATTAGCICGAAMNCHECPPDAGDKTNCTCVAGHDCKYCADVSPAPAVACTCEEDCATCEGFTGAITENCTCKEDCTACPSDANNGSCDCNADDCAECPGTNDGKNCNCTGYCSTCPPNSDNSSCEADPVCNGSVNCGDCLEKDRADSGCICTAKCNLCATGTNKATCDCDASMDCSACAGLTDKSKATCTCAADCAGCSGFGAATTEGCKCKTGKCSACPAGKVDDGCEADTPDDGAFGVKVTMLLAVVAALLAL